jgi:hypothetical protein
MDLNFSEFYFRNIKLHLGVNFDNYYFFSTLSNNIDLQKTGFDNKLYINYFLEGTFDNLDRSYFPTSGHYLLFRYAMLTDNFYEMNHKLPLNVLNLKLTKPFKIGQHIFLTPKSPAEPSSMQRTASCYLSKFCRRQIRRELSHATNFASRIGRNGSNESFYPQISGKPSI